MESLPKVLVVLNPASGKGKTKELIPVIINLIEEFSDKMEISMFISEKRGDIEKNILKYIDKLDYLMIFGGDGTINEVINGLNNSNLPIFIIAPVGSGNDFSSNFKSTVNIREIFAKLISNDFSVVHSDAGRVKIRTNNGKIVDKIFLNALGIGFDAMTAYEYQKISYLKGNPAYLLAVFRTLKKLRPIDFEISIDGDQIKGQMVLLTIGNGCRSGGGFYLNPGAVVNDGLLNLTVIDKISKTKLLRKLPYALINKLDKMKEVSLFSFESCEIKLELPAVAHTDGEIIAEDSLSFKINVLKNYIKIATF